MDKIITRSYGFEVGKMISGRAKITIRDLLDRMNLKYVLDITEISFFVNHQYWTITGDEERVTYAINRIDDYVRQHEAI